MPACPSCTICTAAKLLNLHIALSRTAANKSVSDGQVQKAGRGRTWAQCGCGDRRTAPRRCLPRRRLRRRAARAACGGGGVPAAARPCRAPARPPAASAARRSTPGTAAARRPPGRAPAAACACAAGSPAPPAAISAPHQRAHPMNGRFCTDPTLLHVY